MESARSPRPGALASGWSHVEPRPAPGFLRRAARALGQDVHVEPADLEPRGVGALLDTALDVLRARFLACFGLAFATMLPLALLARALRRLDDERLRALLLELGINFLAQTLVVGLVTHLVYAQLQGRRASALDSLAAAARRGPALLVVVLLAQTATTLGMFCCLVPGLLAAWLTAVAPAALVLEGLGPIAALARSAALMRKALGRWAGVVALQFLLVLPFTIAASALEEMQGMALLPAGPGWLVAETAVRVALLSLSTCFTSVVLTVLYIDGRVRSEGFDLVMRFERLATARGGRT